jgi:uncharacterized protein YodC (DUF2158 family)
MKREFRAGSIVKLKTGTINMIVVKYEQLSPETKQAMDNLMSSEQGLVSVTWFEQGRWKAGKFDPDQLELVN